MKHTMKEKPQYQVQNTAGVTSSAAVTLFSKEFLWLERGLGPGVATGGLKSSVFLMSQLRERGDITPIPGGVQGQAGCGSETPGPVEGVPPMSGDWNEMRFRLPFRDSVITQGPVSCNRKGLTLFRVRIPHYFR